MSFILFWNFSVNHEKKIRQKVFLRFIRQDLIGFLLRTVMSSKPSLWPKSLRRFLLKNQVQFATIQIIYRTSKLNPEGFSLLWGSWWQKITPQRYLRATLIPWLRERVHSDPRVFNHYEKRSKGIFQKYLKESEIENEITRVFF